MAARKRARLSASDVNSLLDLSDSDSEDGIGDISSDSESEYAQDSEAISDCESNSGEEESESGLDERESGEKWVSYLPSHAEFPHFPFTVTNAGIQHSIPVPQTELEYFQKFFTDELFVEITNETNRYAGEKIRMNLPLEKYSIWKGWSDVSVLEMKALIGVVMNMAMNDKCSLQDYFSEQWVDKMPFFKDIFSRNRFMQIFWMLHLNPPTTNQGIATRGHKVKNVVDYIDNKCRANFIPGENIAIDESTVAYKGRIIFKCYNPQKPTKWGLRIYALSDCETGYITVIIPYYGSVTTDQLIRPDLPFTSRIVVHLCSVLLTAANGNGYHLYTDRFYTSYHLAVELLKQNFHTTGTVMPNRKGLPTEIKKKNKSNVLKHQVAAFRHEDENVMVLSWKDKRLVTMLSTFHKVETTTIERVVKQGVIEKINKPTVIVDYTEHMGAVDRGDHYCASYNFARKSLKWWRKMFFWLLEVSIVNAFILMNCDRKAQRLKPMRHKQFRRNLIVQLVGNVRNTSRKAGRPSNGDGVERLDGKPHFIVKMEGQKHKDCAVCSDRKTPGGRRETTWCCETCSRKPGLHPGNCFKTYHTKKNIH